MRLYYRLASTVVVGTIITLVGAPVAHAQTTNITNFSNFTNNGNATSASSVLTLTDNGGSEASTSFYNSKINYAYGFVANFTYTASGNNAADGVAFILQNSTNGTAALGGAGGGLGYGGITPSAAIELNIYNGHTIGTAYATNGATGTYNTTGSVNLAAGDSIAVTVKYSGALITETLFDATANTSYSTSYATDLTSVLGGGGQAYVGFSGGTGGSTATQKITSLNFSNAPEPSSLGLIALVMGPIVGFLRRRRSA